jgi:hypothetical protein
MGNLLNKLKSRRPVEPPDGDRMARLIDRTWQEAGEAYPIPAEPVRRIFLPGRGWIKD